MNLYLVSEKEAEWCVFVFAHTRNRARYLLPDLEYGAQYITTSARLIGKTDEVAEEAVVDTETHPLYPIVQKLGGKFDDLESEEE